MELHQLRYALAVADEGSFTQAAASLRINQSGVSTQVRKLERELGVTLFDRTSKHISLTQHGERMLPTLRAAVAAVEDVRGQASDLRGLIVGSLRVGTVAGLAWPELFDAVGAMHAAHPGIDLRLEESTSADLLARVRTGQIDVAVAAWSSVAPEGLESTVILDDPLLAAVGAGHPWAARKRLRVAEIARADLIAFPPGTGARIALDAMLSRIGTVAAPRWEVGSPAFVHALASRGLGVAIASETTLARFPGLTAIQIDDPDARSSLGLAWRTGPNPQPSHCSAAC